MTENTTSSNLFRAGSHASDPLASVSTPSSRCYASESSGPTSLLSASSIRYLLSAGQLLLLNRGFCTGYADNITEPQHGLVWPPTLDALKSNPVLAYALQSAAKHSR